METELTEAEIYLHLTSIFHDIFDDETISLTSETNSDDISEWDSFNHIKLIVATEQRFKIRFGTAQLEGMKNVGEMVSFVKRKQGGELART